MKLTVKKQKELTKKFMDLLIEDGISEEALGLVGAFNTALECVIDDSLIDRLIEAGNRRRKTEKA